VGIEMIKKMLKPLSSRIKKKLDTSYIREEFVVNELKKIQKGSKILDAGCGSQPFRKHCDHMEYFSQDFAMYESDQKGAIGASRDEKYNYGKIDYIGDIWNIDCESEIFDAVLCTEVFEHIPYPIEAINELSRVLKLWWHSNSNIAWRLPATYGSIFLLHRIFR
jgi:2-polyprenyl-3-methyl-5-hydroxy-6-metoxy-1,4-benzoquinol methylase